MGRLPSGDTWPWPFPFYDQENPQNYMYDPEIVNEWYWKPQGNESAYYVESA